MRGEFGHAFGFVGEVGVIGFEDASETHFKRPNDRRGSNAVLFVVGDLLFAAAVGLVDGALHGVGHLVCVEDGATFQVAGGAADSLDQGALRAEKAFLVGVENGNERDFGEVETFAEEIDADEDVVFAFAEIAEEFYPLERFNFGVHVAAGYTYFGVVVCQVLGHAFGESRYKNALVFTDAVANFGE